MDSISITGIRSYGYIGFFPEEKVLGQWFEVDLTLGLDLTAAGKSDALEDTVDYGSIVDIVQKLVKNSKFSLLEKVAEAIATDVLEQPLVEDVKVSLTKLAAPIPDFSGKVTIEITRVKQK
ncbi:MAG: dihydroneopterin aldolase [Trichodesmium sp. St16_bin2-tuft]|jgi:dihydroneopterin aldolase|nr:dihydroneopterin aldolase [Trichodesmium sp. St18_bin1]MDE5085973.1 dihydroneopterin aldolase [Trichodesmium sp. St16_bin2-tuft]MDE5115802.1 dihydroneopterin aldolase [Trichodesmium sp. St2_bin2_1]MDE5119040.1 dihydroneopterin aldolase [Trichodesmium sp. St19_bin1]